MFRKHWILAIASVAMFAASVHGATFGTVVPIGGEASDLALDRARGVLYIANFTANRIDVMTLSNSTGPNIDQRGKPAEFAFGFAGRALAAGGQLRQQLDAGSATNALTLIDLTKNYAKQTFTLSNPPLRRRVRPRRQCASGDQAEFIHFRPGPRDHTIYRTIRTGGSPLAIPEPPASFPANITQATPARLADGLTIVGLAERTPYPPVSAIRSAPRSSVPPGFTSPSPPAARGGGCADNGGRRAIEPGRDRTPISKSPRSSAPAIG